MGWFYIGLCIQCDWPPNLARLHPVITACDGKVEMSELSSHFMLMLLAGRNVFQCFGLGQIPFLAFSTNVLYFKVLTPERTTSDLRLLTNYGELTVFFLFCRVQLAELKGNKKRWGHCAIICLTDACLGSTPNEGKIHRKKMEKEKKTVRHHFQNIYTQKLRIFLLSKFPSFFWV